MKLYIDNKIIGIIFESKEEKRKVRRYFTYEDMGNVFSKGSFDARKIKKICFVRKSKEYNFLYSGFLQDLIFLCKENEFKITSVKDERTKLSYQRKQWTDKQLENFFPDFKYVGHQVRELRAMLKTNIGIIEAPASSGKTELIIAFIKAAKFPTLIVVNRVTLARQLRKRIKENGFKSVGISTGLGVRDGDILVSTIGSVKKVPNLAKYKILIIDEVHRAQANQFQEFLRKTSYPMRFGFSATPNCGDRYRFALIRQFMGNVIYRVEAGELIENEVIALPKIEFIPIECPPTLDWPSANYRCIVWNKKRNEKIKKLVLDNNLPTLVLIHQINHGKELTKLIPNSVFVSGIDDADTRDKVISGFENNQIKTIISSNIFNEGISINAIRLLVVAGGGKSKIETVQRLGRGLRLDSKTGKKECLVFDFYDYGNRFTEKHSEMRKRIYTRAGFEVSSSL